MLAEIESILDTPHRGLDASDLHLKVCHLMGWVMVHLEFEQTELYPSLQFAQATQPPSQQSDCWRIGEEIAELRPMMANYEARFRNKEQIAGSPDAFIMATFEVSRLLRDRIGREERLVYPLADRLHRPDQATPRYFS